MKIPQFGSSLKRVMTHDFCALAGCSSDLASLLPNTPPPPTPTAHAPPRNPLALCCDELLIGFIY